MDATNTINIEIRQLPARRVVAAPHIGPYHLIGSAFERLFAWAGPRGMIGPDTVTLGVYYDDPATTPEGERRAAACVSAAASINPDQLPAGFDVREIPGGRYAVYHTEIRDNDFAGAWMRMSEWLRTNGEWRYASGPSLEIYLNDAMSDPEHKWVIEICAPVCGDALGNICK